MCLRAQQGFEKALGPDHISTLKTVNNFGNLYRDQGKLGKAEKMYQRALQGYEKALGPEDILHYLPALNIAYNLGRLYSNQGERDKVKLCILGPW
jgi:tetratricopeptide (TPR) repeat protein